MNSNEDKEKYVAFLRGINIGRHHKVPMVVLKEKLKELDFENININHS